MYASKYIELVTHNAFPIQEPKEKCHGNTTQHNTTQHNTAHRYKLLRTLLAAACAAGIAGLAVPASAEGWYAGASFGNSKDNDWCEDVSGSCDDKDSGWKLFAGNQFNKNAAIEFGYVDLGETSANGTVLGIPVTATGEATGFNVSLVGMMPVGATSNLTGRIGLFRWDSDVSGTAAGIPVSVSDSGTDLAFGVGASFGIGKNAALRIEWERFQDIGDEDDVDLLSLGIAFNIK